MAAEATPPRSLRQLCIEYLQSRNPQAIGRIGMLLGAKDENALVAILLTGTAIELRGKVSGFAIDKGQLKVIFNNKEIPFDAITGVRKVDIRSTLPEIGRYFRDDSFLKPMFEAQEKGLIVQVAEPGVEGMSHGHISNIHTEDGELVFNVAGKEYRPQSAFDFRIVPDTPIENSNSEEKPALALDKGSSTTADKLPNGSSIWK